MTIAFFDGFEPYDQNNPLYKNLNYWMGSLFNSPPQTPKDMLSSVLTWSFKMFPPKYKLKVIIFDMSVFKYKRKATEHRQKFMSVFSTVVLQHLQEGKFKEHGTLHILTDPKDLFKDLHGTALVLAEDIPQQTPLGTEVLVKLKYPEDLQNFEQDSHYSNIPVVFPEYHIQYLANTSI